MDIAEYKLIWQSTVEKRYTWFQPSDPNFYRSFMIAW
jgi:hypothetical protein